MPLISLHAIKVTYLIPKCNLEISFEDSSALKGVSTGFIREYTSPL